MTSLLISCISTILLVLLMSLAIASPRAHARAFFVFGDSLVDIGNNNYLLTIARADFPPYGIDAPNHLPTGRFSNGLNIADLIGQAIGAKPLLPSLSPELQGDQLLNGANFASAGVGILDDTGLQFFYILKMSSQLESFRAYQQQLIAHIGEDRAQELVTNALYLVTVGGNDLLNNYFLPSFRTYQFTVPAYVNFLISEFDKLLTRLYDLGARRVLVTGTGPLGCAPAELCLKSINGQCASDVQEAVNLYNPQLDNLLKRLNSRYGADIFITANMQKMSYDFLSNPQYYGFKEAKVACCGQGRYNGDGFCTSISNLCPNREEFVFWDAYHPTEKANRLIVQQILNGTIQYMTPMNLSTIMAVDSRT